MKLADYAMREAISNKDWPAAIAILAHHFGVVVPPAYLIQVFCHPHYVDEVTLDMDKVSYSWLESEGFHSNAFPRYKPLTVNIRAR